MLLAFHTQNRSRGVRGCSAYACTCGGLLLKNKGPALCRRVKKLMRDHGFVYTPLHPLCPSQYLVYNACKHLTKNYIKKPKMQKKKPRRFKRMQSSNN